jgi:hypothetical protein
VLFTLSRRARQVALNFVTGTISSAIREPPYNNPSNAPNVEAGKKFLLSPIA